MAEVTFDYQNLIEVEGGLQGGELDELGPRLREAADGLRGQPGLCGCRRPASTPRLRYV